MKAYQEELVSEAKRARHTEREATKRVLKLLQRIEHERIHHEMGYPHLHSFCVKVLEYSDGEAHRRVQAMRLLETIPEAEKSLDQGTMTLTTLATLQVFFKNDE